MTHHTGFIPPQLGQLFSLELLILNNNKLTGMSSRAHVQNIPVESCATAGLAATVSGLRSDATGVC